MADGRTPDLSPDLSALLAADDERIERRWEALQRWLEPRYGRLPGIEALLFLIGIQSRGKGFQPKLNKKNKQDLIMEGTCCAFETLGLYRRVGKDANGHIAWERAGISPIELSLPEQEKLLRLAILKYFDGVRNEPTAFHQPQ